MSNDKSNDFVEIYVCDWCEKAIPSQSKYAICLRCYNLLINAGVSEKEILEKTPLNKLINVRYRTDTDK